jgi:preprotein translocase subunit SecE
MTAQDIETISTKGDIALTTAAVLVALAGVIGFSFLSQDTMLLRVGLLFGGLVLGLVLAWFARPGKRFIAFAGEAWDETRRVIWPTQKETINVTGVVFGFVAIMSVFLFVVDKTIEWGVYDVLLRWK